MSICDPCIGGGAMMVAAASRFRSLGINYHDHVMFVGQDVDRVAGLMSYIQLSLLGCPGYIDIANTLSYPLTGDVLIPTEKEGQEFWYTPFYFKDTWDMRRHIRIFSHLFREGTGKKTAEAEPQFIFFFNYEETVDYVRA